MAEFFLGAFTIVPELEVPISVRISACQNEKCRLLGLPSKGDYCSACGLAIAFEEKRTMKRGSPWQMWEEIPSFPKVVDQLRFHEFIDPLGDSMYYALPNDSLKGVINIGGSGDFCNIDASVVKQKIRDFEDRYGALVALMSLNLRMRKIDFPINCFETHFGYICLNGDD